MTRWHVPLSLLVAFFRSQPFRVLQDSPTPSLSQKILPCKCLSQRNVVVVVVVRREWLVGYLADVGSVFSKYAAGAYFMWTADNCFWHYCKVQFSSVACHPSGACHMNALAHHQSCGKTLCTYLELYSGFNMLQHIRTYVNISMLVCQCLCNFYGRFKYFCWHATWTRYTIT